MAANNTSQQTTENAISTARTSAIYIYEELLPDAPMTFDMHDQFTDELMKIVTKLDEASTALMEFGFDWHNAADDAEKLGDDVAKAEEQIDALSFTHLADTLLRELQGRMMNQDPKNVVWWIEAALTRIADTPDPDHPEDTTTLLNEATWRN